MIDVRFCQVWSSIAEHNNIFFCFILSLNVESKPFYLLLFQLFSFITAGVLMLLEVHTVASRFNKATLCFILNKN